MPTISVPTHVNADARAPIVRWSTADSRVRWNADGTRLLMSVELMLPHPELPSEVVFRLGRLDEDMLTIPVSYEARLLPSEGGTPSDAAACVNS